MFFGQGDKMPVLEENSSNTHEKAEGEDFFVRGRSSSIYGDSALPQEQQNNAEGANAQRKRLDLIPKEDEEDEEDKEDKEDKDQNANTPRLKGILKKNSDQVTQSDSKPFPDIVINFGGLTNTTQRANQKIKAILDWLKQEWERDKSQIQADKIIAEINKNLSFISIQIKERGEHKVLHRLKSRKEFADEASGEHRPGRTKPTREISLNGMNIDAVIDEIDKKNMSLKTIMEAVRGNVEFVKLMAEIAGQAYKSEPLLESDTFLSQLRQNKSNGFNYFLAKQANRFPRSYASTLIQVTSNSISLVTQTQRLVEKTRLMDRAASLFKPAYKLLAGQETLATVGDILQQIEARIAHLNAAWGLMKDKHLSQKKAAALESLKRTILNSLETDLNAAKDLRLNARIKEVRDAIDTWEMEKNQDGISNIELMSTRRSNFFSSTASTQSIRELLNIEQMLEEHTPKHQVIR